VTILPGLNQSLLKTYLRNKLFHRGFPPLESACDDRLSPYIRGIGVESSKIASSKLSHACRYGNWILSSGNSFKHRFTRIQNYFFLPLCHRGFVAIF
jgi:hypothetical protein